MQSVSSFSARRALAGRVLASTRLVGFLALLANGCSSSEAPASGDSSAGNSGGGALGQSGSVGAAGAHTVAGSSSVGGSNVGGGGASPVAGAAGSNAGVGGSSAGTAGTVGLGGSAGVASGGVSSGGGAGSGGSAGNGGNAGSGGNAGNPPDVGPTPDAATRAKCTGTSPIVCHLGGNPGQYAVTAVVGGSAAANTEIQAEMHRLMMTPIISDAGATKRYSFVVDVRTPEGQPVEDGPTEGTPGLDLYFYGSKGGPSETGATGATALPELSLLGVQALAKPVGLWVAGDSTVCDQSDTDYSGWAQMLPASFNYPVSVGNLADSGESAVSFLHNTKMWPFISSNLQSGDWVLIQFGHNDSNDASGAFHDDITTMVTQAKAKGAHPVLVSPPARATFSGQTLTMQFSYGWGVVPTVMKQISTEQSVPYIDLTATTTDWYNKMGPSGWQAYHALGTDKTHTNRAGALMIAQFVAAAIKSQGISPLDTYLR
jgi:lysophospholipase L1-like esterase